MQQEAKYDTALILPGGGARAAYQVGVIKALATLHGDRQYNPYRILCGTSAGAINAVALASKAENFSNAADWLESLWTALSTDQIYRSDWLGVMSNAWRLLLSLFNSGIAVGRPVGLLDNSPLRELLKQNLDIAAISENINAGHLDALSVTAMDYTQGVSISFFQGGPERAGWQRWRRQGVPTPIDIAHVMASTAIPTIFPPQRIGRNYFGDGALRQLTPISPALHLGAERVLIIPANGHRKEYRRPLQKIQSPAFGQIIGHLLNSAFVDSIETDIERLERINQLIRLMPEQESFTEHQLRPIEALVISPSEDIDAIADDFLRELPRSIRTFFRGNAGRSAGGVNVASYLLFTTAFSERLIQLGYNDGMANIEELRRFVYGD
ncbi:NTE family protein [Litorivivens lipolytica]|uniref:NTE family protein n=1 Tax=Litorivivens lipolytica TaxID=1524264 RepID=A0A7W4Z4N1_9GAMM|nr:patatin-like phospholipase family protein [Litorivivens lipolytica]MBB3046293.1 NTE family protein [Litorivivens lipolytica]